MIVSILGAGALGKAYGAMLAAGGHDVHYLVRSEFDEMSKAGFFSLHFLETKEERKVLKPKLYKDAAELPPSDLILLAVKTTSNGDLRTLLKNCRTDSSIVLVVQNGIGNEEWISQFTAKSPLLCGISMMGASRKSAVDVDIHYLGPLTVAPYKAEYSPQVAIVRDMFAQSPIVCTVHAEKSHLEIRWFKLIWNVPFGALSLMYDKAACVIAGEEPYHTITLAMTKELQAIAKADGVLIPDKYVHDLIELTRIKSDYFPSIYVDFKQGRKIEKEYIFDNVLDIATKYEVSVPLLRVTERYLNLLRG